MAYQFNGSDQRLTAGTSSIFQIGSAFTASAVVSTANATLTQTIMAYNGNPNVYDTGWIFRVRSSQLNFGCATSVSSFNNLDGGTIANNTTHTVAFTSTAGSNRLFINGSQVATASFSVGQYESPVFAIGGYLYSGSSAQGFNGTIAEVGIWNVALTDDEILGSARGFTPDQIRPQSLQFYAPLVRNLIDVRGGRAITNVNSATVATHPRIIS